MTSLEKLNDCVSAASFHDRTERRRLQTRIQVSPLRALLSFASAEQHFCLHRQSPTHPEGRHTLTHLITYALTQHRRKPQI